MEEVRKVQYALKKELKISIFESNKAAEKQAQDEIVLDEDGKIIAEIMLCKDLNKLKQEFELLSGKNKTIKAQHTITG